MANTSRENKKLFIVCPYCQLEDLIRKEFGDVLFLSAMAACFEFEMYNIQSIKALIEREVISDIYIVMDCSCIFKSEQKTSAVSLRTKRESRSNQIMDCDDKGQNTIINQLRDEVIKWQKSLFTIPEISSTSLRLHLLLTEKQTGKIKEIQLRG